MTTKAVEKKKDIDPKNLTREQAKELGVPYYDNTMHWVKFSYLEQPGQELTFSFGKTVYNPHSHNKKGTVTEKYNLKDGNKYELPQYIIEHLSNIVVPDPSVEKSENGMIRIRKDRVRNRFSLGITSPPDDNAENF